MILHQLLHNRTPLVPNIDFRTSQYLSFGFDPRRDLEFNTKRVQFHLGDILTFVYSVSTAFESGAITGRVRHFKVRASNQLKARYQPEYIQQGEDGHDNGLGPVTANDFYFAELDPKEKW